MNERYQKYTGPQGKTRKSAAAAKPKRDAGASSKKVAKKSSSGFVGNPDTPEFRRLRKMWWYLLGSSLAFTLGSLALRQWTKGTEVLATAMLVIGYALIFGALYLDWGKMRKMRQEWLESGKAKKDES